MTVMEKFMNFTSNGFWKVMRKCYVLDITILFICRVSFWREDSCWTVKSSSFFWIWNLIDLVPLPLYWWRVPVFLFPAPLAPGAETQAWSHRQSQDTGACAEWWRKSTGTFKSFFLGSELEMSVQLFIPWVWPFFSSISFPITCPFSDLICPTILPPTWELGSIQSIEFYLLILVCFYGFLRIATAVWCNMSLNNMQHNPLHFQILNVDLPRPCVTVCLFSFSSCFLSSDLRQFHGSMYWLIQ